ncbi:MAG: dockerin type I repeat-containing protein [Flavobacteriales bacterium]|nr:dockerin type I repeat-containing protein [Flavobacteriales bacterium]
MNKLALLFFVIALNPLSNLFAQIGCDQNQVLFQCYHSMGATVEIRNESNFIIYQNIINSYNNPLHFAFELSLPTGCYTIQLINDPDSYFFVNFSGVFNGPAQYYHNGGPSSPGPFAVGDAGGCSDPTALNYNPYVCSSFDDPDFWNDLCVYDDNVHYMTVEICEPFNGYYGEASYEIRGNCSGILGGYGNNPVDGGHVIREHYLVPEDYTLTFYEYGIPPSFTMIIKLDGVVIATTSSEDPISFTVGGGPVLGCTDYFACNYDAGVLCDDNSCNYGTDCCIGNEHYFAATYGDPENIDEYVCYDFYDENLNWITSGCIYEINNEQEIGVCLPNGCFILGTYVYGLVDWVFTNSDGNQYNGSGSATLYDVCAYGGLVDTEGCLDPQACNYDSGAAIDNNSCMYGEHTFHLYMWDDGGNGWEGSMYIISDANGNTVAEGTYNGDSNSFETAEDVYLCLDDGCYTLNITGGNNPSEVHWLLYDINNLGYAVNSGAPYNLSFFFGPIPPTDSFVIEMFENGPFEFSEAGFYMEYNGYTISSLLGSGAGNYWLWPFCGSAMGSGCYHVSFNGGNSSADVTWSISGTDQGQLTGNGSSDVYFTWNTGGILGCMDIVASNYNPNATCDNNSCQYSIPGDLNGDGNVNASDVLLFLAGYGCTSNCAADMSGDGIVNGIDLLLFLAAFGG